MFNFKFENVSFLNFQKIVTNKVIENEENLTTF